MKQIFIYFLFSISITNCFAQTVSNQDMERKIKTTDLYIYGESTYENQDDAISEAKRVLITKILEFEPSLFSKNDLIINAVRDSKDVISMPRGIKYRAIAFILKSEIQEIGKISLTDQERNIPVKEHKISESFKQEEEKHLPLNSQSQSDPIKFVNKTQNDSEVICQSKEQIINTNDINQVSDLKNDKAKDDSFGQTFSNGIELLKYIISVKDANILSKLFEEQKHKGMLVYGGKNSMLFPDKCYLVVYSRDGIVKAYLDMGNSSRKNLITGEYESLENYKDIPYIWFQVMN